MIAIQLFFIVFFVSTFLGRLHGEHAADHFLVFSITSRFHGKSRGLVSWRILAVEYKSSGRAWEGRTVENIRGAGQGKSCLDGIHDPARRKYLDRRSSISGVHSGPDVAKWSIQLWHSSIDWEKMKISAGIMKLHIVSRDVACSYLGNQESEPETQK